MSIISLNRLPTAAAILSANNGVGPGFDALRLLLSVWIFTVHSFYVVSGSDWFSAFAADPFHRMLISPALPMFFAVSGYLVTGSALRTRTLLTFLVFRTLRIAPALCMEVTLSALILGPWLTESTLINYFTSSQFFSYFLNILGSVHWFLPGLFIQHPTSIVNANLWTLRPEFFCYIFMVFMIASKSIFNRKYFSFVGTSVLFAIIVFGILRGHSLYTNAIPDWMLLIVAFIIGCLAFHWNDHIVISHAAALFAGVFASASVALYPTYPYLSIPGLVALTYVIVYLGTRSIALPNYLSKGDYSYGIYLFGFPLQQTIMHFLPTRFWHGLVILLLGLPLTFAFASLSWKFIEKPALKLKTRFKPGFSAASKPAPHLAV